MGGSKLFIDSYSIVSTDQFIELTKNNTSKDPINSNADSYVCPKCKEQLKHNLKSFKCNNCKMIFPIVDEIPILISYQNELPGFKEYLTKNQQSKGRKFIT